MYHMLHLLKYIWDFLLNVTSHALFNGWDEFVILLVIHLQNKSQIRKRLPRLRTAANLLRLRNVVYRHENNQIRFGHWRLLVALTRVINIAVQSGDLHCSTIGWPTLQYSGVTYIAVGAGDVEGQPVQRALPAGHQRRPGADREGEEGRDDQHTTRQRRHQLLRSAAYFSSPPTL